MPSRLCMSYELSIPLKRGTLEIEFEDLDDLQRQLRALDVPRIERLLADALKRPAGAKRAKAAKKGAAKKTRAKKSRAA